MLQSLVKFSLKFRGIVVALACVLLAQAHRANQVVGVAVILNEANRRDAEGIGALQLRSATGALLPLHELADVFPTSGRFSIQHDGARRRQTVTCATNGRDVTSFVEEAKQQVAAKVIFPAGTYPVFTGEAEAKAAAQRELLLHSGIAVVAILMLLSIVFRNWRNLLLVLANVPFALVGGVLAVWLTGVFGDTGESGLITATALNLLVLPTLALRFGRFFPKADAD